MAVPIGLIISLILLGCGIWMLTKGCPDKEIYTFRCYTLYLNETIEVQPFKYIGRGSLECHLEGSDQIYNYTDVLLYECSESDCYFKSKQTYLFPLGWKGYSTDLNVYPRIEEIKDKSVNANLCIGGIIMTVFGGAPIALVLLLSLVLFIDYVKDNLYLRARRDEHSPLRNEKVDEPTITRASNVTPKEVSVSVTTDIIDTTDVN